MILQTEKKHYTPEEYLDFEIHSDDRHEYIDGEVICVTGGTPNHNQIAGNFYAALNFALKQQAYRVFFSDQRLWIPRKRIYTYPDVMLVQGELQFYEGRQDTILNPMLIVEVLSRSTRSHDKDEKFVAYQTISRFQEYLLFDQYTMHAEQYYKTDSKRWMFLECDDVNEVLSLNSIPFQITLADIYDKVEFRDE